MAGHSKFKNIQHRKGAQDKKRSKIFTKLARDIVIAANAGGDPDSNPKLRNAIAAARAQNLPKDRIEKAILQGSDASKGDNYFEMRYEGFFPGGIAFIVESLTDNKNRTASDIRSIFSKYGGNLGETGNVSFKFEKAGFFIYKSSIGKEHDIIEDIIDAGADDIEFGDENHIIYCNHEIFNQVLEKLMEKFGFPDESYLGWRSNESISIADKNIAEKILKLTRALEDHDDVQNVFYNYEFDEELMT